MRKALLLLVFAVAASAQTPVVNPGGVVNAASFATGQVVTPGSIVAIFGSELAAGLAYGDSVPLSNTLAGVSVSFNDIPAPILLLSQGEIRVQLPWNLLAESGGAGTANVIVRRGGVASAAQQVQVGPFSPGIFSSQLGMGQAMAFNPDGSLAAPAGSNPGIATHPTMSGGAITILATGLGAVDSAIPTGQPSFDAIRKTLTTPVVLVGGKEAQVLVSELSALFVGFNQILAVIPDGVAPGDTVPLQIRIGGITTTDQVTIAVSAP